MTKSFYVDSCIWLNLFKKEGDASKGIPYWKTAKDFLEKVIFSDEDIFYSGLILRELQHILQDDNLFKEKLMFFKEEPKFRFVEATKEDYASARKLESEANYEVSFYDCLHIAICKRLSLILITRDNILIAFARDYISAEKPENLLP